MLISKFDLTFFTHTVKVWGFRRNYELINGKLNHLALIDVSEIIRFDNNYKYVQEDPLKEYLNRPLNKFEIYERDGAVYHHYILEGL